MNWRLEIFERRFCERSSNTVSTSRGFDHKLENANSLSASSPFALVLFRCLRAPFLTVIVPRLFVIGFRYGQPVLIRYAIEYVQSPETNEDQGYTLVSVAAIVYIGLAVGRGIFPSPA